MPGSASSSPVGRAELREVARALIDALPCELDPRRLDLAAADLVSSGGVPERDHAAGLGVMCAQQLHQLCSGAQRTDPEDVFELVGALDFVLRRLGDGAPVALRGLHDRLVEIGMSLSDPVLRTGRVSDR